MNGELTMGEITESFKRYCMLIQSWYRERFIDIYFGMPNWQRYREKYKAGSMGAAPFDAAPTGRSLGYCPLSAFDMENRGDIVVVPPVLGPDGEQGIYTDRAQPSHLPYFLVGAMVKDDRLIRILQIWELMNFGRSEDYVCARWGRPGAHAVWSGEPWASSLDLDTKHSSSIGPWPGLLPNTWQLRDLTFHAPQQLSDLFKQRAQDKAALSKIRHPYFLELLDTEEYDSLRRNYMNGLERFSYEYLVDVVRDNRDIESTWDTYVEDWLFRGGAELITALRALPAPPERAKDKLLLY